MKRLLFITMMCLPILSYSMHENSFLLFEKYALNEFKEGQKVFEIAPGKQDSPLSYKGLIDKEIKNIEYYWGNLKAPKEEISNFIKFKSEYEIEAQDETFDIVFCGQVLEHVRKPWIWIKELARITKKDGKIILINPISWGYHKAPVDCWRIYPDGIKALFEEAEIITEFSKFESLDGKVTDTISIGRKK